MEFLIFMYLFMNKSPSPLIMYTVIPLYLAVVLIGFLYFVYIRVIVFYC